MTDKILLRCPYGHDSEVVPASPALLKCLTCGRTFGVKYDKQFIYLNSWDWSPPIDVLLRADYYEVGGPWRGERLEFVTVEDASE